jgi:putative ABC transport system permease protein
MRATEGPMIWRAAAGAVLWLARWIVPASFRTRWYEEWRGELLGRRASPRLLLDAGGAWPDAFACRAIAARARTRRSAGAMASTLRRDLRDTWRHIVRAPGSAAAAMAALALGMTTLIVAASGLNAVLFRPLPGVDDRDSLVSVFSVRDPSSRPGPRTPGDDEDLRRHAADALAPALEIIANNPNVLAVSVRGEPTVVRAGLVSTNYFRVLGTSILGRGLIAGDERAAIAVVSHTFAMRHFGSPEAALGSPIHVGGFQVEITGVAPRYFLGGMPRDVAGGGTQATEIWLPLGLRSIVAPGSRTFMPWVDLTGRLKPGVSKADAQRVAATAPRFRTHEGDLFGLLVRPFGRGPSESAAEVATVVAAVMAVPLIVLLVGCANAANLLLARATTRRGEIAVRRSLGATRGDIVRQLVIESTAIAAAAGLTGASLTVLTSKTLTATGTLAIPVPIDWRIALFTTLIVIATGVLFGFAPAMSATRNDSHDALKDGAHAMAAPRSRMRNALVVAQIALSLALLVVAALFARTFQRLQGIDADASLHTVAAATLNLDVLGYTPAARAAFQRSLIEAAQALPGVTAAATSISEPFSIDCCVRFSLPGDGNNATQRRRSARGGGALGPFIEAAGIPIVAGRRFTEDDRRGPARVAIVTESLAKRTWPDGPWLGQPLRVYNAGKPMEVTVVGIARSSTLSLHGSDDGAIFLPSPLEVEPWFTLWVRAETDPAPLIPAIRQLVKNLDPRMPIVQIGPAEEYRRRELQPLRLISAGLGGLGFAALLLAAGGLYAVMTFIVTLRGRELGIRVALGARPGTLMLSVLRDASRLAAVGVAVGFGLAALSASVVRVMFMGASSFDPVAFGSAATVLAVVAIAAALGPARRAARVDPMVTLRQS